MKPLGYVEFSCKYKYEQYILNLYALPSKVTCILGQKDLVKMNIIKQVYLKSETIFLKIIVTYLKDLAV